MPEKVPSFPQRPLWLLSSDQWEKDDVDGRPKGQSQRGTGHRAIYGRTTSQIEEREDLRDAEQSAEKHS